MGNEWEKEQARVREITKIIDNSIEKITKNQSGIKKDIVDIRKTFWDDVTVNFDEPDDVGETFTSIKQQTEMLAERERTHTKMDQRLKSLAKLKYSPYFGRFDFHEEGVNAADRIYIGTSSLMDEKEEEFLIYDWRAPISSLYYDYATGPASFETLEGTIEGDILLKRQFIIRNGMIKGMFDTGVTIGDEVLQQVLSDQATNQMKSIVATIQKEQNEIIRNETSNLLFVQGVAGSGKTSAALQRIAYLLYRYRGNIQSDNIMLFSPNPMFSNYVATVLPELGEDNMEQMTFQDYVESRLDDKYTVENPFTQMEYVLTAKKDEEYEVRMEGIRFKGSNQFEEMINAYLYTLSAEGLLFKDIKFRGKTIITSAEIKDYFYSLDSAISIPNRISLTSEWLLKEVKKIEKAERKKEWVEEEAQYLEQEDYQKIFKKLQKKNQFTEDTFNDFEREQIEIGKFIVRKHFYAIKKAIKALEFINIEDVFCQLFTLSEKVFGNSQMNLPEHWSAIKKQTITNIKRNYLQYEDAIAFLYLKDQIEGRKANTQIRHLFIDEAQDYTPFQFSFLKQLYPMARMTILGDINQAIFAESMNAPSIFSTKIIGNEKMNVITLTKSYRSTKQIVEFAKWLISGGAIIEPINRIGKKTVLVEVSTKEDLYNKIEACMRQLQNSGHGTIALICKSELESNEAYQTLSQKLPVKRIDKNTSSFETGMVIIPVYLAKGIEFDAVLIHDASKENFAERKEQKLLYTACTRAMHELYLFSLGEKSHLLNEIPKELYEVQSN